MPENIYTVAPHEHGPEKRREIGGIPLPKELPPLEISRNKFRFFAHRGHGEETLSRFKPEEELSKVDNVLTGLETGIKAGADTLELDLALTNDGEIVTGHIFPTKKGVTTNAEEYLRQNPEAFRLNELMDWLLHQPPEVCLYMEMKSHIPFDQLLSGIDAAVKSYQESQEQTESDTSEKETVERELLARYRTKDDTSPENTLQTPEHEELTNTLLDKITVANPELSQAYADYPRMQEALLRKSLRERLLIYGQNSLMTTYLEEKTKRSIPTEQLKLMWIQNSTIAKDTIDTVTGLGTPESRIYGIEQGGMPWGTVLGLWAQEGFIGKLLAMSRKSPDFLNIEEIVDYAHDKNLKFIVGTVDNPAWIRTLIDQGIDGIVPNNGVNYEMAGINRPAYDKTLHLGTDSEGRVYIPNSMKQRLEAVPEGKEAMEKKAIQSVF